MRARANLGIALASLAALVATVFVLQSRGEQALSLLLFAGAVVSIMALEVDLRAAPIVVGIVFLLLGIPLWREGGPYAVASGALLLGSAFAARGRRPEPEVAQAA